MIAISAFAPSSAYSCHYYVDWTLGYTCQFEEISYLEENSEFLVEGQHFIGLGDDNVLAVRSTTSNISYIPKELLPKFLHLKQFLISDAGLESIDGVFDLCSKMEIMKFYQNKIKQILSRAFVNCPNLVDLDFGNNEISYLDVHAFEGIKKLETLSLYNNPIKVIEPGTFDLLPNLEKLWMLDLEFTELHPRLFLNLNKLQFIQVGTKRPGAKLTIRTGTFSWFADLEYIQIMNSKGESMEIEPYAFNDLQNLQSLFLHNSQIQRLDTNSFKSIPKLEWFHLAFNKIKEIERSFFSTFPLLDEVYAQENECTNQSFSDILNSSANFTRDLETCFWQYENPYGSTQQPTESTTADTTQGSSSNIPNFLTVLILFAVYSIIIKIT